MLELESTSFRRSRDIKHDVALWKYIKWLQILEYIFSTTLIVFLSYRTILSFNILNFVK